MRSEQQALRESLAVQLWDTLGLGSPPFLKLLRLTNTALELPLSAYPRLQSCLQCHGRYASWDMIHHPSWF